MNILRSPTPAVNEIVQEISLDLAEGRYSIDVLKHLPGKFNEWADALSRIHMPDTPTRIPFELLGVERVRPAKRVNCWWLFAAEPFQ